MIEQPQLPNPDRELDQRINDGVTVSLMWQPETNTTYVTVDDSKQRRYWRRSIIDGEKPTDVFKHPFAYLAELDLIAEDITVPDDGAEAEV